MKNISNICAPYLYYTSRNIDQNYAWLFESILDKIFQRGLSLQRRFLTETGMFLLRIVGYLETVQHLHLSLLFSKIVHLLHVRNIQFSTAIKKQKHNIPIQKLCKSQISRISEQLSSTQPWDIQWLTVRSLDA